MPRSSPNEAARQRARLLKRVLAGLAAVGFVAAGVLARGTHPGQATSRPRTSDGSASVSASSSDQSARQDDGDGFAIAPSSSQPQVQTGVS